MGVQRAVPESVVDDDGVAEAPARTGQDHLTGAGSPNPVTGVAVEVDAVVLAHRSEDGMDPRPESRCPPPVGGPGHQLERAVLRLMGPALLLDGAAASLLLLATALLLPAADLLLDAVDLALHVLVGLLDLSRHEIPFVDAGLDLEAQLHRRGAGFLEVGEPLLLGLPLPVGVLGPPQGPPPHHFELSLRGAQLVGYLQLVAYGQIEKEQPHRAVVETPAGELLDHIDGRLHVRVDGPLPQAFPDGFDLVDQPVGLGPGRLRLGFRGRDGCFSGRDARLLELDVLVQFLERGDQGLVVRDQRVDLGGHVGGVAGKLLPLLAKTLDPLVALGQCSRRHQRGRRPDNQQRAREPSQLTHCARL